MLVTIPENATTWDRARQHLDEAQLAVASLATLLDDQRECALDDLSLEAKRLEADLSILESRLRRVLALIETKQSGQRTALELYHLVRQPAIHSQAR
jgi:hypothetical protein